MPDTMALIGSFLPLILMLVLFYLMIMLPEKKRKKKFNEMVAAIEKGDQIITIGGIEGKVIQLKDTTIVIETGKGSENEKTTLTLHKWAIKDVKQKEKA
ncbi:MAG: preprotein translocase subunit YajC [Clostridia bacterium]|nr:preprotein translocase subunit YajC [Clostridia bacterium]